MSKRLEKLAAAGDRDAALALWRAALRTGAPLPEIQRPGPTLAALDGVALEQATPLFAAVPQEVWTSPGQVSATHALVRARVGRGLWSRVDLASAEPVDAEPLVSRAAAKLVGATALVPRSGGRAVLLSDRPPIELAPRMTEEFRAWTDAPDPPWLRALALSPDGSTAVLGFSSDEQSAIAIHAVGDGSYLGGLALAGPIAGLWMPSPTDLLVPAPSGWLRVDLTDPFAPAVELLGLRKPAWAGDLLASLGSRGLALFDLPQIRQIGLAHTPTSVDRALVGAGGTWVAALRGARVQTWHRRGERFVAGPVSDGRIAERGLHPTLPLVLVHRGGAPPVVWDLESDAEVATAMPIGARLAWTAGGDLFVWPRKRVPADANRMRLELLGRADPDYLPGPGIPSVVRLPRG